VRRSTRLINLLTLVRCLGNLARRLARPPRALVTANKMRLGRARA
jgi:hypothetical protein